VGSGVEVGTGVGVEDGTGEGVTADGEAAVGKAADGDVTDGDVTDGVTVSTAEDGGGAGTNRRHARPINSNATHRKRFIL